MTQSLSKNDISDLDFVAADELASDRQTPFLTSVTVVSTTASTKRIVVSGVYLVHDADQRIEPGDYVELAGTSGGAADGTYTVDEVIDDVTLVVLEAIADSTGGSADFIWPPGASRVGFDPTGLSHTTAHTVQGAIVDLDAEISSGGITESQHKVLKQLIHFIDDGPAEGFGSSLYREISGGTKVYPTLVTWYEDSSKIKKIVEKTIGRTGIGSNVRPNPITWKVYAADGVTVVATIIDVITYEGVLEVSRIRYTSLGNLIVLANYDAIGALDAHSVTVI
jgi:hypothetical protein